jgi:hypothetical protein
MDEEVLDDLPGLFRKLPDGHYKIMLKEPGERDPRLLLDINLRGGRPEDSTENVPETPAGADEGAAPETGWLPAPMDGLPAVIAALVGSAEELNSPEIAAENAINPPATVVGGTCAAAALASCVGRDWEDRVDEALADAGSQTLSKAARLVRRLRRPAAQRIRGRLSRRPGGGSVR